MKRLIAVASAISLMLVFATPAAVSASGPAGGPPVSISGPIDFHETIAGWLDVYVIGNGTLTAHIVRPNSSVVSEESWFEVADFTGWVSVYGVVVNYDQVSNVKVTVHVGTQPSQLPLITVRSSQPFLIPYYGGPFTMVQMVGGQIIFAK